MKFRVFIFLSIALLAGCNDPFDDADMLEDMSGDWLIETSYIGLTQDNISWSKYIPISYPDYRMTISSKGQVSIYKPAEGGGEELISSGSVKGLTKKKLLFNESISNTLNEIGYFEKSPTREYRVIEFNGILLEINYVFKNSSEKKQYEGFFLLKMMPK